MKLVRTATENAYVDAWKNSAAVYLSKWIRRSNTRTGAEWITTRFGATSSVERLLDFVINTPADPLPSFACVEQRQDLIKRNLEILRQMQTGKAGN